MKGKTFLILLAAAGILVALSFLRFGDEKNTAGVKMGAPLFADFPVNAVATVIIADSENTVTLVKGDTVWEVKERSGYPANFDELGDTVLKLSRLKIGRSFSGSPKSLARLSLMGPSASDASTRGKQITLKDASGKIIADVIVGQHRDTDSGGDGGQYLKKTDADTVFLVDGNFQFLKTAPAQWLKKEILNIKADEIESLNCHLGVAQDPVYRLSRPEKGAAAQMTPVPQGRTADPAKIDQVLDALAPLTLDDVQAGDDQPPVAEPDQPRLVYHLYDGRRISIFPHSDAKDHYTLRVTAEAPTAGTEIAEAPVPADGEVSGDEADKDSLPSPRTAEQLNQELSPWVFSVKKWQFDSLITQPGALLIEEVKQVGDGKS